MPKVGAVLRASQAEDTMKDSNVEICVGDSMQMQ